MDYRNDRTTTIIIIVLVVLLIVIGYAQHVRYSHNKSTIIEAFSHQNLGFATPSDPYTRPQIINDVLTLPECHSIISVAQPNLIDSQTIGGANSKIRNSRQHWIPKSDPLAAKLISKVAAMYNIPFENAEDLQVVRYHPGQFYKEHHDACCDQNSKCEEFIKKSGQRILTVLVYLNDAFTDGETEFQNLNLRLKAKPGSAIVFHPLADKSSFCHPLALHAGLPVTSGEKWIANVWFRERKW